MKVDREFASLIPPLRDEEAAQLEASLLAEGCRDPLVAWKEKDILLDGHNRHRICKAHLLKFNTANVSLPSRQAALVWIIKNQFGRRNLSPYQRAELALKLKPLIAKKAKSRQGTRTDRGRNLPQNSAGSGETRDEIAVAAGVSHDTIAKAEYLNDKADEPTKAKLRRGETSINAEYKKLRPHVSHNAGDNEWYTPEKYIKAARATMGSIDLDPASTAEANEVVKAKKFFTAEQDGLLQEWSGHVWLNPPYASDLVGRFAEKLIESPKVRQAVILVNNATETKWFQLLLSKADSMCLPAGRVKFWHRDRDRAAPLQGQAILYFGIQEPSFFTHFEEFGAVCHVVRGHDWF